MAAAWLLLLRALGKSEGTPRQQQLNKVNLAGQAVFGTVVTAAGLALLLGFGPHVAPWLALVRGSKRFGQLKQTLADVGIVDTVVCADQFERLPPRQRIRLEGSLGLISHPARRHRLHAAELLAHVTHGREDPSMCSAAAAGISLLLEAFDANARHHIAQVRKATT